MRKMYLDLRSDSNDSITDDPSGVIIHLVNNQAKKYNYENVQQEIQNQLEITQNLIQKQLKCNCDIFDYMNQTEYQYDIIYAKNLLQKYNINDDRFITFLDNVYEKLVIGGKFKFIVPDFMYYHSRIIVHETENSWTISKIRKINKSVFQNDNKSIWTEKLAQYYFQEYCNCDVTVIKSDDSSSIIIEGVKNT